MKKSYVFVWDNQALCYNPENTTDDICNDYLWVWLRSSEWEKALLELAWDFDLPEGCWMSGVWFVVEGDCESSWAFFMKEDLKLVQQKAFQEQKLKHCWSLLRKAWGCPCCVSVSPRYHPHSCGWSSLHLRVGPRLQELLQKFRLVKEDSAIGEVWICWVSDTRKGFCVIVWKYQPFNVVLWVYWSCWFGVGAAPVSDWALWFFPVFKQRMFCTWTTRNLWNLNCFGSLCWRRWCP